MVLLNYHQQEDKQQNKCSSSAIIATASSFREAPQLLRGATKHDGDNRTTRAFTTIQSQQQQQQEHTIQSLMAEQCQIDNNNDIVFANEKLHIVSNHSGNKGTPEEGVKDDEEEEERCFDNSLHYVLTWEQRLHYQH